MNVHLVYYEIDYILMLISAKYCNLSYYDIFKVYLYIMYRFLITYTEDHCLYDEYSSIIMIIFLFFLLESDSNKEIMYDVKYSD